MEESFNLNILKHPDAKLLITNFKRKLPKKEEYLIRLVIELDLIISKKLVVHLLQVIEILKLVEDIPHIIRGSSGSSLVCYGLGISPFDPIKEKVSFSRFLNDQRENLPDVDMDFPYNQRDEVFKRINNKWVGCVARISNHLHYKEKSALRKAFKIMGYKKLIPKNKLSFDFIPEWKDDIKKIYKDLLGEFRGYSLHCGGIVIYPNGVPRDLLLNSTKTEFQIKDDKRDIQKKGLFKIDILSNRGLAQLLDVSDKNLDEYPTILDDNIKLLFETGNNLGLTFAESPAMRKVLSIVKPKNLQDIALCLALIRPAAGGNGNKNRVLDRASKGQSCIDIIYDDDAIQYIKNLTNLSEGESDMYRKAFSKNKKGKLEFFTKMLSQFGYKDNKISYIKNNLSQLQKYSFCKSHALSYAKLVGVLAYQKVYQPIKFWVSTLNHCNSMYKKWVHFNEAKTAGIKLTLGKRPWILTENNVLVPKFKEKHIFKALNIKRKKLKNIKNLSVDSCSEKDSIFQFKNFGYWISPEFIPNMYLLISSEKKFPKHVKFKGLIACGRIYPKYQGKTFITIGYQNGRFLDLTLNGKHFYHKYHYVEGEGYLKNYLDDYHLNNFQYIKKTKLLKQGVINNALMVQVSTFKFGWL